MKNPILTHILAFAAGLAVAGVVGFVLMGEKARLERGLEALETQRTDDIRRAELEKEALLAEKAELEATLGKQNEAITALTRDRDDLQDDLEAARDEVEEIQDQVGGALKTVGVLDKLSKIDPELLQKYSKIYFLNEHYAPPKIAQVDKAFVYDESRAQYLHAQIMPFFEDMVEEAKEDGIELYVVSAYRSFDTQSMLKSAYRVTYGSGANAFSADQGYSEHQLGTTIDFTTTGINGGLDGFETTPAYAWLQKNAHKFGFVLSYPEDNQYYIFEPWHWRFVGQDLADTLHDDGKHFYDMDQREIDKYLVSFFD
jgi:LAS superfamily LD-carboxypeptidase LdcB